MKLVFKPVILIQGLAQWLSGKESTCNAGATGEGGSIPGLGGSSGGGHGSPLQYSCLENPMDRGVWWPTVHRGCKESDTTEMTAQKLFPC